MPENKKPPRGEAWRLIVNLFALSGLLVFDQIEPLSRPSHACRREVVVNGCSQAGSGVTHNALRVVLDRDDVSARSRCVKLHSHRAGRGVLRDRARQTITIGAKHTGTAREVE